eukprot:g1204.t1
MSKPKEVEAAIQIQCAWRRYSAEKILCSYLFEKLQEVQNQSSQYKDTWEDTIDNDNADFVEKPFSETKVSLESKTSQQPIASENSKSPSSTLERNRLTEEVGAEIQQLRRELGSATKELKEDRARREVFARNLEASLSADLSAKLSRNISDVLSMEKKNQEKQFQAGKLREEKILSQLHLQSRKTDALQKRLELQLTKRLAEVQKSVSKSVSTAAAASSAAVIAEVSSPERFARTTAETNDLRNSIDTLTEVLSSQKRAGNELEAQIEKNLELKSANEKLKLQFANAVKGLDFANERVEEMRKELTKLREQITKQPVLEKIASEHLRKKLRTKTLLELQLREVIENQRNENDLAIQKILKLEETEKRLTREILTQKRHLRVSTKASATKSSAKESSLSALQVDYRILKEQCIALKLENTEKRRHNLSVTRELKELRNRYNTMEEGYREQLEKSKYSLNEIAELSWRALFPTDQRCPKPITVTVQHPASSSGGALGKSHSTTGLMPVTRKKKKKRAVMSSTKFFPTPYAIPPGIQPIVDPNEALVSQIEKVLKRRRPGLSEL